MRKIYVLLFALTFYSGYSQVLTSHNSIHHHTSTVTTILDSPDAIVDDALAFDSEGNLYGSNFDGDTVYKLTPSGEVSPFVTGLVNPNGLAFDSHDNLYVVEYSGSAIHKYDIDGNLLNTFPVGGAPSGMIKAFHSDNMIFTKTDDHSVNELLPDGSINVLYQGAPLNVPVGLAYSRRGVLYVGNYLNREIYKLPYYGCSGIDYVATVPDSGTIFPYLAFITYARGSIYGTVYGEHKVYKVNPREIDDVEIFAGSTNGNADGDISEATFSYPAGIISNKYGNKLYVSEFSGVGHIRKISIKRKRYNFKIKLKAYPNPATDFVKLKIYLPKNKQFEINIVDMSGNTVFESNEMSTWRFFMKTIEVSDWTTGFYQIIVSSEGSTRAKKIYVK